MSAVSENTYVQYGKVNEDGSFSLLARITCLDGTGEEVIPKEGPCITQADVASITAKVYSLGSNKDSTTGIAVSPDPTFTASTNIFNTLRTSGWPTNEDQYGYNGRFDFSPTYSATGDNWYLLEIKITLSSALNNLVIWVKAKYKTVPAQTS